MVFQRRYQPKIGIREAFEKDAATMAEVSNRYFADRRGYEISKKSNGLILDMGAGCGLITEKLLNKGSVIACDISLPMVKMIKKKYKVPVVVADAESIPFKNETFDCVVNSELIYYLQSPQSFFDEAKRVLRKDGACITSCFSQYWLLLDKIRNWLKRIGIRAGIYASPFSYFYSWQIIDMYRKGGFNEIDSNAIIFLPIRKLHNLNLYLEKTSLRKFCLCNIIWGIKFK